MSEDFAQAAIRGTRHSDIAEIGPFRNALFLRTRLAPKPAAGSYTFDVTDESGQVTPITVFVSPGDSFPVVADRIEAAIDSHANLAAESYFHPLALPAEMPYVIVVNPQSDVDFSNLVDHGTGLDLVEATLDYSDAILTMEETIVLGLNIKPILGNNQVLMDTIATSATSIMDSINPGFTGHTYNHQIPEEFLSGLSHTVVLVDAAADGSDVQWAQVSSHEYGHFLLDEGDTVHPPPAGNEHLLMAGGYPFPPTFDPPEVPQFGRRLTPAEAANCRSDGAQFLTMPCVLIPERK
jgi:hypothetical protein